MGIEKFRRNLHVPGMIVTGVTSTADLDIRSTAALDSMTVTNQMSAGLLTVDSTCTFGATVAITGATTLTGNVTGATGWAGFASFATSDTAITVSATNIASGIAVTLTAQQSVGGVYVDSIVDDTSFMVVANDAVPAAVDISYIIIRQ
jgi:hypothetical protein